MFQSSAFAEFQEKIPSRGAAWMLAAGKSTCLAINMPLPLGYCWLWVPYGPLIDDNGEGCTEIFAELRKIAGKTGAIFARVEPPANWRDEWRESLGYAVKSPQRLTPQHSLVVDLMPDEEGILAGMKPKGRYNIRVARRQGVEIRRFDNFSEIPPADFDAWYELLEHTAERDDFGIHEKKIYESMMRTFARRSMISLFLAYAQNKVAGGIIVLFSEGTAIYYYGAFSWRQRNLMAPYLLQWEAMRCAKKRGLKIYDFFGIAPANSPDHEWSGITAFKKKFGGTEVSYPPAFDVVYKPLLYHSLPILRFILSAIRTPLR